MAALNDSRDDNGKSWQGDVDRLSQLPDDVLVLLLERLRSDVRLLAQTGVLSKRWRTLPLMVSRIFLSDESFLYDHATRRTSARRYLHRATSKLTSALRFFLATNPTATGHRNINTLTLHFTLTKDQRQLNEIARLIGAAVGRGEVRRVELLLDTVELTSSLRLTQYSDNDSAVIARVYARRFLRLLRAGGTPLASSITRLELQNQCFRHNADLEAVVVGCVALEALHLDYCWFEYRCPVFTVDAPRSRLRELRLTDCGIKMVHLVQVPELAHFCCDTWVSDACPVTFGPGSVPALVGVTLINDAVQEDEGLQQRSFKLSELMENANPVEYMHLDFGGDMIWLEPEYPTSLGATFSKLRELHLANIFSGATLSWTMFLLKAAPLLELFSIHECDNHVCKLAQDDNGDSDADLEREEPEDHFIHRHLQTVEIRGGLDVKKDLMWFVRLILDRAVNLKLLHLNAAVTCKDCISTVQHSPFVVLYGFPECKGGVDSFVWHLKDGISTSARIIVRSASNKEFVYG